MQNLGFTLIFLLPATWFINKSQQHPDLVGNFTQLQPSLAKVQTFHSQDLINNLLTVCHTIL